VSGRRHRVNHHARRATKEGRNNPRRSPANMPGVIPRCFAGNAEQPVSHSATQITTTARTHHFTRESGGGRPGTAVGALPILAGRARDPNLSTASSSTRISRSNGCTTTEPRAPGLVIGDPQPSQHAYSASSRSHERR